MAFGTFILWFGWYGFNAGSTTALSGSSAEVAGHCAVTTTLAAACGGFACFILASAKAKKYDLGAFANGILGGLVGITAGCASLDTGAAAVAGAVGGVVVFGAQLGLEAGKIDDPIGAFAVHGAAGAWGVIAEGLFNLEGGVYYGSGSDVMLIPNIMGVVAIAGWVVLTCAPLFIVLKVAGIFRASLEMEKAGLDTEMVAHRMESKLAEQEAGSKTAPEA